MGLGLLPKGGDLPVLESLSSVRVSLTLLLAQEKNASFPLMLFFRGGIPYGHLCGKIIRVKIKM